jgi:NAD(P)-dependent dehydrogenase (short-subunit alcohol dehydrogenase family)
MNQDLFSLAGKTALITGATRGIGWAIARPLTDAPALMEKRLALTPLRRVGTPEEVSGMALLLATPAGGFITGQNFIVDGGTTIGDGN